LAAVRIIIFPWSSSLTIAATMQALVCHRTKPCTGENAELPSAGEKLVRKKSETRKW
jgi:hypothetical protein